MNIKKYTQITVVLAAFFILVWARQFIHDDEQPIIANTPKNSLSTTPTPTPSSMPMMMQHGMGTTSKYKDGTFTGTVADAYYGYVQIRTTITNGKITSVEFLQYPNDARTSQRINSQAMPILQSQALQAQSAQVNGVSGASATSDAFIQSFGNALAQAKNA